MLIITFPQDHPANGAFAQPKKFILHKNFNEEIEMKKSLMPQCRAECHGCYFLITVFPTEQWWVGGFLDDFTVDEMRGRLDLILS